MTMNINQARIIDPVLTEVTQGYRHPERIGHVLFPRVPVFARGGQIIEFGKESFRRYNTRRAPGTNTKRLEFGYQGKPFVLVQDALEGMVPSWYRCRYRGDGHSYPGTGNRAGRARNQSGQLWRGQ